MKLRRSAGSRVFAAVLAAVMAGFAVYLLSEAITTGRPAPLLLILLVLPVAAGGAWSALQWFEVDIDRTGWTMRVGRFEGSLRWSEIAEVVIEDREIEGRGRRVVAALYVVPVPALTMEIPEPLRATVDGRPAIRLFDLPEIDHPEETFVRELSDLAGDLLTVRLYRLNLVLLSPAARARLESVRVAPDYVLPVFPAGAEGARTRRWLNLRKFGLFAGWHLLVVLPSLVLIVLGAQLSALLGGALFVAALVAAIAVYTRVVRRFHDCAGLLDDDKPIGQVLPRGEAAVLPPGSVRGFGRAWLLASPAVVLLLGDPRTGRLRGDDDLRALAEALRPRAEAAARQLDDLAERSRAAGHPEPAPFDARTAAVWIALTRVARVAAWLLVAATVLIAGGWHDNPAGTALIVTGCLILVSTAFAALYCLVALLRAIGKLAATLLA